MKAIRFIHTADVHLGSLLSVAGDALPTQVERAVTTATFESFQRICSAALARKVEFVLIAGDLYDREARSVRAQEFFCEQCQALAGAGIKVYVIAGNHDPLRETPGLFGLPDNVRVFSADQPEVLETPLARIIGQSYKSRSENRSMHLGYQELGQDLWNIALLHTQLDPGNTNYAPCSLGDLKKRTDIHYWALGHIHQQRVLSDSTPLIAFPGIPQGRHFGEQGRGGCLLVELGGPGQAITFIPTAPISIRRIDVCLDDDPEEAPQTIPELEEIIIEKGRRLLAETEQGEYPLEGYLVEWIIRGRSVLHSELREQEQDILELLRDNLRMSLGNSTPFLWTNAVTLRTQGLLDYENLFRENELLRELEQIAGRLHTDQSLRARLVKSLGLIWQGAEDDEGRGDPDDFRFFLDPDTLKDLVENAKQLVAERLTEGREL